MTENYPPPPATGAYAGAPVIPPVSPPVDRAGPSTKDVAKDQAANVKQGAGEAGQHVAGVAKEQAGQVTAEAGRQAKDLLNQAQGQVQEQASVQQQKLVSGLRSLSDELSSMSQSAEQPGVASDLARQAGERTGAVAGWLDGREPAAVLDDVSAFARRRPGAFLAIAAGVGFVAGRLTRGLKAQSDESGQPSSAAGSPAVVPPVPQAAVRPAPYPGLPPTVPPSPYLGEGRR